MIKEKTKMGLKARVLLVISISSLVLYLSVEGLNILPSIAQPNSKLIVGNQLEKNQDLPVLDERKEASRAPDDAKRAPSPIQDGIEGQISSTPTPSPVSEVPSPTSLWGEISGFIDGARKTIAPVTSSIVNEAEAVSSSIFGSATEASSPTPSPFSGPGPNPSPYPNPPATSPASGSGPTPSPSLGINPPSPSLGPGPGPAPFGFYDHDVALAIEARIKQSQSDAQLAMDEAKKLLNDPNIASTETGKCLSKCVDKYGTSLNQLNQAITDLGVRDVTLLSDDFGAVETDISTCQACFTENIGEDSPLKALEEATTKAARECLTVMDYAA